MRRTELGSFFVHLLTERFIKQFWSTVSSHCDIILLNKLLIMFTLRLITLQEWRIQSMNEKDKCLKEPTKTAVFSYASLFLISLSRLIYDLIHKRVYEHVILLIASFILLIISLIIYRKHMKLYEKFNGVQHKLK